MYTLHSVFILQISCTSMLSISVDSGVYHLGHNLLVEYNQVVSVDSNTIHRVYIQVHTYDICMVLYSMDFSTCFIGS